MSAGDLEDVTGLLAGQTVDVTEDEDLLLDRGQLSDPLLEERAQLGPFKRRIRGRERFRDDRPVPGPPVVVTLIRIP